MIWQVIIGGIAMVSSGMWIIERANRVRTERALKWEAHKSMQLGDELSAYRLTRLRLLDEESKPHRYHVHGDFYTTKELQPRQRENWQTMTVLAPDVRNA